MTITRSNQDGDQSTGIPTWLVFVLAVASGLTAANIYYAQPLVGPISRSLGMSPGLAGIIVTVTQFGYGGGLLFLVPLSDLVENRALIVLMVGLAALALMGAALSTHAATFLPAAFLIGVGSVAVQIIVPFAAHLSTEVQRGRVVGNVMSGLMLGIMLARPVASMITDALSWPVVFLTASAVMAALGIFLRFTLPRQRPVAGLGYVALLASMIQLARHSSVLRRRALYHTLLFCAFTLFWTTVPLLLAEKFHISQNGIAWFSIASVAGAVAAPLAGWAADCGWSRPATRAAMFTVIFSLCLSWFAASDVGESPWTLLLAAVLLDFGVIAHFVLGQRAIFSMGAKERGRLNGLYMAAFFSGGAVGSAVGSWTYTHGGWPLAMSVGVCLPALAIVCTFVEPSRSSLPSPAAPRPTETTTEGSFHD